MFFPDSLARLKFSDSATASGISETWLRQFQAWVRNIPPNIPGPYANDAAAGTAGVTVGQIYYQTSGTTTKLVTRLV